MAVVNPDTKSAMGSKKQDIFTTLGLQGLMLVLFGIFTIYGKSGEFNEPNGERRLYPMFQDVHVMIFIGFGFLMTFLKRYGFSSVGFNFLLGALMLQWSILCEGFYDLNKDSKIEVSLKSLLHADVATATVLISMGAVLGRTTYVQLLIMGVIEIAVFCANSYLGEAVFKVVDAGDSIFVHTFGAYFGLAVSYMIDRKKDHSENSLEGSSYNSDLFAMIGTVFLWMFWPSFNSAELTGDDQHRAVINTYLSLASCCVTAFAISALFTEDHKFDMVHVQNSTLAGGVAVGTAAQLMLQPYGALIVGAITGAISVFGYSVLTPWIDKNLKVHDTCGVHNLHGMPGVIGGIIGAVMAAIATEDVYKDSLYTIFTAMAPVDLKPTAEFGERVPGDGRTAGVQAGYQILAVVVTIAIAVVSGLITGFILNTPVAAGSGRPYEDDLFWLVHEPHAENGHQMKVSAITNPSFQSEEHFSSNGENNTTLHA